MYYNLYEQQMNAYFDQMIRYSLLFYFSPFIVLPMMTGSSPNFNME